MADREPRKRPGGNETEAADRGGSNSVDVGEIDLSAADVIIVEAPSGARSVVKGRELVDAAKGGSAPAGRPTARVMTVRCDHWSEVELLLSRLGL